MSQSANRCGLVALLLVGWMNVVHAQDAPAPAPKTETKAKSKATRKSRPIHGETSKTYMGREIAEVMGFQGADWLIRPEREEEEQPDAMLDALKIKPGDTVADIGAGVGYTSARISKRVGPKGTVLAVDIQPQMLSMLRDNMKVAGVKNVKPILCTATDPKLPEATVDLAIMVDVYHECSDPVAVLKGIKKGLKPGGRLVLVEFRAEDPNVPIKPEHKMTLRQVRAEIEPQGFTFKELQDFLPWQHIIIFERPKDEQPKADATKPEAKPKSKKADEDDDK